MHSRFWALPVCCLMFVLLAARAAPLRGADEDPPAARLVGRVLTSNGEPAEGARVRVSETTRAAVTDAEGRFELASVPPGRYLVEAESARLGRGVAVVDLAPGVEVEVELRLEREVHGEEVVVTASPDARRGEELARPVSVLAGDELMAALAPTLGETLAGQAGVHSSWFGPGASRPVIRGMSGDRIRILESGLGVGDASGASPDHAVALETLTAERIEIVRGPATLLYGSSAVGGVVNVLDESIPSYLPEAAVTGQVTVRGSTNGDERSGSAVVLGHFGRLAWYADGSRRDIGEVEIPGPAERPGLHDDETEEPDPDESPSGRLAGTALASGSARVGLSWIAAHGFVGLSASGLDSRYGVPGHAHPPAAADDDDGSEHSAHGETAQIDLEQRRFDLHGELQRGVGPFAGFEVRLGSSDYEHQELQGEEVGTRFRSQGFEGRLEARHRPVGALTGAWGVQAGWREFEAVGEEAFVPPTRIDQRALFAFEQLERGSLTWQLGARHERHEIQARDGSLPDRSFDVVSGSAGVIWKASDVLAASASLSRSVTPPTPEALYADGPHLATRTWEVGDPTLGEETSYGVDLGGHLDLARVHLEASLFWNRIDDFVYQEATGLERDGLVEVAYRQADARTRGGEFEAHVELIHRGDRHLDLDLAVDLVRAELDDGGALPRTPPLRWGGGLTWKQGDWSLRAAARRFERQDRIAAVETPTDGYTLVEASVARRFFLGPTVHDIQLVGTNLGDAEARAHTSWLKDLAPLPGRDVRLTWRLTF